MTVPVISARLLDLPWHLLSPSVRVDVLSVVACDKPAIRICLPCPESRHAVALVIAAGNWSSADDGTYLVAAQDNRIARHILAVDRASEPHVRELGLLLGYPTCCVAAAVEAGEANIDSHASHLGARCDRQKVWLLDPRGYGEGLALVPFVACSPRCVAAQHHAVAAQSFVEAHARQPRWGHEPWVTWRATLQSLAATTDQEQCEDGTLMT